MATLTAPARAVIRRFRHTYVPPVTSAPLVFVVVFDLEIPNAERCRQTQEALVSAIASVATDIARADRRDAPVVGLPSIEVALAEGRPCRQAAQRTLDGGLEAVVLRRALLDAGNDPDEIGVLVVYANNLPLEVPPELRQGLSLLRQSLHPGGRRARLVTIGDPEVLSELAPDGQLPWTSALEPTFRDRLDPVLSDIWPLQTVLHGPTTVIPLADPMSAAGLEAYRICRAQPVITALGLELGARALEPVGGGPAYRVNLPTQRLTPARSLTRPTVEVEWEGCYGLCERPGPSRTLETSWLREDSCPP